MNLLPRFLCIPVLCTILFTTSSWAAALWLYEGGTPDLGTAAAGRQQQLQTLQPLLEIRRA